MVQVHNIMIINYKIRIDRIRLSAKWFEEVLKEKNQKSKKFKKRFRHQLVREQLPTVYELFTRF